MKNGVTTNINTKHQCITAMKEYEAKSLEVSKVFAIRLIMFYKFILVFCLFVLFFNESRNFL